MVLAGSAGWLGSRVANGKAEAPRPNILIVLAHDPGFGKLGCQGKRQIPTPNIDAIAAKGALPGWLWERTPSQPVQGGPGHGADSDAVRT